MHRHTKKLTKQVQELTKTRVMSGRVDLWSVQDADGTIMQLKIVSIIPAVLYMVIYGRTKGVD